MRRDGLNGHYGRHAEQYSSIKDSSMSCITPGMSPGTGVAE